MKTLVRIVLVVMLTSSCIWAQPGREGGENLEAIRVAFITNKLSLNTEEAERFWPVHNEMSEEMQAVRDRRRALMEQYRTEEAVEDASESELLESMQQMLALEQEELDIRAKYHDKFLEVLDAHKVALLYRAEEEFKRMLIERMRGRERSEMERRRRR